MSESEEIIKILRSKANPSNAAGMARFGISSKNTLGIPIPELRKIAKKIGKNHKLAKDLWKSGIHEARILAGYVGEPDLMTEQEFDDWAKDFDSWDVCDQVCSSLLDKTKFAYEKISGLAARQEQFVKRTAFTLMACMAVHDKKAGNRRFLDFFPLIKKAAVDERNFVKKAVNWALRQIGKRNLTLNKEAIKLAKEIQKIDSKAAKWIAGDALRELQGESVQKRLKTRYNNTNKGSTVLYTKKQ